MGPESRIYPLGASRLVHTPINQELKVSIGALTTILARTRRTRPRLLTHTTVSGLQVKRETLEKEIFGRTKIRLTATLPQLLVKISE